jgi:hypothetical protein
VPYTYKVKPMNHNINRFLFALLLGSLTVACEKESSSPALTVDEAFQPYFEAFEAAGAARGLSIDLNSEDIGAVFSEDLEAQTAGKCTSFSSGARIIYIDESSWGGRTEMEKEFLIFHELGHCYLDRVHLDEADENGFCVSIMQSGKGDCVGRYTVVNREGLLDELFE